MKKIVSIFSWAMCLVLLSCSNSEDAKTMELLNGDSKGQLFFGAYKAGLSRKRIFVPLVLKNAIDTSASDPRSSYEGKTLYRIKMEALNKIFHQAPPIPITEKPDSLIIKFYTELAIKQGLIKAK